MRGPSRQAASLQRGGEGSAEPRGGDRVETGSDPCPNPLSSAQLRPQGAATVLHPPPQVLPSKLSLSYGASTRPAAPRPCAARRVCGRARFCSRLRHPPTAPPFPRAFLRNGIPGSEGLTILKRRPNACAGSPPREGNSAPGPCCAPCPAPWERSADCLFHSDNGPAARARSEPTIND